MILLINKPRGMTSHDVVDDVRRQTGERRVGHAGTLDPLAAGVLIVLVGRDATKRQAEFMKLPKIYEAKLTFGSASLTYDAEGPLTQTATFDQLQQLAATAIRAVLPSFTGTIMQQPPAYSALKRGGETLYKKARRGTLAAEDITPRPVTIDTLELLAFVPLTPPFPPTARLRIACHSGTYIRSLANDIGKKLSVGAYLSDLVRTAIGDYTLEQSVTLQTLQYENLHENRR